MKFKGTHPISFPALVRLDGKLLCTGPEITGYLSFKEIGDNRFSVREPLNTKKDFVWLIDANGKYREFVELSRGPQIPSFLKKIYNLTRIEYELTAPVSISCGRMKGLLKGTRGGFRKKFEGLLEDVGPESELTKKLFLHDYMNEPLNVVLTTFPK